MQNSHYGRLTQVQNTNSYNFHVEEIRNNGYSVINNLLTENELQHYRSQIDTIYEIQENAFGKENLEKFNEIDVCRIPIEYDDSFINLVRNPIVINIIEEILGDFFILNLQNTIINSPQKIHHQNLWQISMPHQNFVISNPLAINALFCLVDFSTETGATTLLPYTHKMETIPSEEYIEKNSLSLNAPAGSVILFDSMLLHKVGYNNSSNKRRAVNHIYTSHIIKQFYDFPRLLNQKFSDDAFLAQLLGYTSQTPLDDMEWRKKKL